MTIIIIEHLPENLRGECTRYLLEIKHGVFIGTISALIRDLLWNKIISNHDIGGSVLIYSAPTEQGF